MSSVTAEAKPEIEPAYERTPRIPRGALLPTGVLISFLGSMAGIGGGLFAVPVLHFLRGVPLSRAVATSLGLVLTTATLSTITESFHAENSLRPVVLACVVGGALVGIQVGFRIAERIGGRALRILFITLLLIAAARVAYALLGPSSSVFGPGFEPPSLSVGQGILCALIGFLGGGVAPLFGIGGGLIVTPALFLVFPQAGFVTARAIALANAMVTGSRSLYLHHTAGRVVWAELAWLVPGAALGAILGTQLVHGAGVARYAQGILLATLLFTAVRFLRDLKKTPASAAASKDEATPAEGSDQA